MFNFLDSYRFSDGSSKKLSATRTFFPSLGGNGRESELFKKKFASPYEKGKAIESFFQQLKLGREHLFSTLKQSYPGFEEIIWTQAIVVTK